MPHTTQIIAVVGDVHGLHQRMVNTLQRWEARHKRSIDVVLQVGDFEPHRHESDLQSMNAPSKYKHLGDFGTFHQGRSAFPWPVYFIGGNHEPYGWLDQHLDGFELIDNCTYLGRAGVRTIAGCRVAYLTGIYTKSQYNTLRPPIEMLEHVSNKTFIYFNERDIEQVFDAATDQIDILLVHDWPANMFDEQEWFSINGQSHRQRGMPGNAPARLLVDLLQPRIVCAGHMHMRVDKIIEHDNHAQTQFVGLGHTGRKEESIALFDWDGEALSPLEI